MLSGRFRSIFSRSTPTASLTPEDQRALAAIEQWTLPQMGDSTWNASVHVVAGAADWRFAAWMLASWFHFTESRWSVCWHDDGTCGEEVATAVARLFPAARFISRKEADATLRPTLAAYPFCETLREDHPSALRIFDPLHYGTLDRLIVLDSHLLFFKFPRELVDWAGGDGAGCWFNQDETEYSLVSPAEARDELGLDFRPRVGDGLWLLPRSALDLDFMDTALARTTILRGALDHTARTLAMLCAARAGEGGVLPAAYEMASLQRPADDAVARQYAPKARSQFVREGIPRVSCHLFAREV